MRPKLATLRLGWKEGSGAMRYKIVRKFFRDDIPDELIESGLTIDQARSHCSNSESSSTLATTLSARAITRKLGPWFDAYYEDEDEDEEGACSD